MVLVKKIDFDSDFNKSISLNWRYTPPADFEEKIYDFKTELYFLGKLFEEIIIDNDFQNFRYRELLKKMVEKDYKSRITSFFDLNRSIISESTSEISFTIEEKKIYQKFANDLTNILSNINIDADYINDIPTIIRDLSEVHRNSILEEHIQKQNYIARCFIKGTFSYWKNKEIDVETVYNFNKLLTSSSKERQKVIINNLWQRLDNIERHDPKTGDELPF